MPPADVVVTVRSSASSRHPAELATVRLAVAQEGPDKADVYRRTVEPAGLSSVAFVSVADTARRGSSRAEHGVDSLVHPDTYAAAGLDPVEAVRVARRNPVWHDTIRWMGEKIMPFLAEAGMVTPAARRIYRRAHLL